MTDPVRSPQSLAAPSEEEIEALLRMGLRNRWYPLCPSSFVTDRPLSLYRLGIKMVLWRDASGTIHVQDDHCPHRGAPLSAGRLLGDRIVCAYHGIEISPSGKVIRVPGSPGCLLEGMQAVRTYPSRELRGAIFAYVGDALHPEPCPLEPPLQLAGEEYDAFLCYAEWKTPWRYLAENNLDPMHGTFLHKQSHSMSAGDVQAKFRISKTPVGFRFEKVTQHDVNFDWSEWCDTGMLYARLEIPYPKTGGPGGNFGIIYTSTPINDRLCANFFWRNRKVSGWQRDTWRFLFRNRLEARHWQVLEQDRMIAEGMEPEASQREFLYDHDVGVAHLRRFLRNEAVAQLTALGNAGVRKPWQPRPVGE